jgi:HAD domain in Swiss Army Knife RNA repair proteins
MKQFLFLDFDGVLHPAEATPDKYFCHRLLLSSALAEFPDLLVVVSSSWKRTRSASDLQSLFGGDLAERLVGKTPNLEGYEQWPHRRQNEIEQWMKRHAAPWDNWVALDDSFWEFRPFCPNLIICDPLTGLNDASIHALQRALRNIV